MTELHRTHQIQAASPLGEAPDLRDYLAILRRRKWYVILTLVAIVGVTILWTARQESTFTSTSQVLVQSPTLSPTQGPATFINMETERSLAQSSEVAVLVKRAIKANESPSELLSGVSVETLPETEILAFSVTHPDPDVARERAQAFAEGYLQFRQEQFLREAIQRAESLHELIDSTQTELESVNERLQTSPEGPSRDVLESRAQSLQARLDVLQQNLVTTSGQLQVGQIVQAASPPRDNDSTTPRVALAISMGLAIGVGIAFLVERLDNKVRGRQDLENHFPAPVLAVIPRVSGWRQTDDPMLAAVSEPDSPAAEAFRTLRTGILFAASQKPIKTILVTSAESREGKTATAANLAVALARAGKKVILLSGDLRRPRLHNFFRLPNTVGLTNVLAGERDLSEALQQPPGMPNLKILNSGAVPGNPSELLSSQAMQRAMVEIEDLAEIVVIDGAPVLAIADSLILSRLSDAVLLVAHAHRTTKSAIDQARRQLEQVNASVIGSVLNSLDPRKATDYERYESYGYVQDAK